MKRLFALLLPLCLLLAGCSRNTQTLQEEVDRLKRENTALLETIDRLQEQLSALQSTSLESWSLEARGADAASPVQILFTARPCARPDGQTAQLLVTLDGEEITRADCLWDGENYTAAASLLPENGYGYYCLLADGEREPERILLSTPDSPAVPKLTYLAGSLEAYANALTQHRSGRCDRCRRSCGGADPADLSGWKTRVPGVGKAQLAAGGQGSLRRDPESSGRGDGGKPDRPILAPPGSTAHGGRNGHRPGVHRGAVRRSGPDRRCGLLDGPGWAAGLLRRITVSHFRKDRFRQSSVRTKHLCGPKFWAAFSAHFSPCD